MTPDEVKKNNYLFSLVVVNLFTNADLQIFAMHVHIKIIVY